MKKIDLAGATKGLTDEEIRRSVNSTATQFMGASKASGNQPLSNKALGEFRNYGFKLLEQNDGILELFHNGKRIASYNKDKVTIPIIREGCLNYLANINRD